MKRLYIIVNKSYPTQVSFTLLNQSAKEKGVEVIPIVVEEFDFLQPPSFSSEDGLYRISTSETSRLIEKFLINKEVLSFYQNYEYCVGKFDNVIETTLLHQKNGLPIIPTILYSPYSSAELLKQYARSLNGFPLILKSIGGQHGVGVIKVDSLSSLYSLSDYIRSKSDLFILRKFIDCKQHARLIVLGEKVIDSIEYKMVKDDFRSNVGEKLHVLPQRFSQEIEDIAVQSVKILGLQFGGVDILIDQNNQGFIAEVNFPCFFPRCQLLTGTDISGMMVNFLIEKSTKL